MTKSRLLKKEKNENQHVISCLSGNPAGNKALHNLDSRVKPENDKEMGRSMVEMLGVLAVMGVLSVAGIAGYNNAMNRHRANEILNEASKRAVVVAGQAMMGKTGEISLAEFGNNSVSGATFGTTAKIENNQIQLTLSGVADSVCAQMKNVLGDNSIMAMDDKCTVIAFNADMTKGVTKPTSCNPACTGCQTCDTKTGVCMDNDFNCSFGKECNSGTCECPEWSEEDNDGNCYGINGGGDINADHGGLSTCANGYYWSEELVMCIRTCKGILIKYDNIDNWGCASSEEYCGYFDGTMVNGICEFCSSGVKLNGECCVGDEYCLCIADHEYDGFTEAQSVSICDCIIKNGGTSACCPSGIKSNEGYGLRCLKS